jgi:bifunctional enzyme CysN/CysC
MPTRPGPDRNPTGATIWLTGLPGAGKSSLAGALRARLALAGRQAYVLDGDELRKGLSVDLGFSAADRAENVRRAAHVARMFADAGGIAIVALVSPYAADRGLARRVHETARVPFMEVFVDTPLEICRRRDPKQLYSRARRGEVHNLTGVDDPYEPPQRPELRISGADRPVEDAATVVLESLKRRAPGALA